MSRGVERSRKTRTFISEEQRDVAAQIGFVQRGAGFARRSNDRARISRYQRLQIDAFENA